MDKAKHLVDTLESSELSHRFSNMLAEQEGLSPEGRAEIEAYFKARINSLVSSINDIVINGDEDEMVDLLNLIWLECRIEWNRYNSQMQYQTFTQGQADPILMARGACLSGIVEAIEKDLDSQSLYWVIKLAGGPVDAVSYRLEQTKKLIEKTSSYSEISQKFIKSQIEVLELLKKTNVEQEIIDKVEKTINMNIETIEESGSLSLEDFSDGIEGAVVKGMKKSSLQFQVNNDQKNLDKGVSPNVANVIEGIISEYIESVVLESLEKDPTEREGKSSFVNFDWEISIDGDLIKFVIKDDGLGKSSWQSSVTEFGNLKFDYGLENQEGKGSCLTLLFSEFSVQNFLVFSLTEGGDRFAIPASRTVQLIRDGQSPFSADEGEGEAVNFLKWPQVLVKNTDQFGNDIVFQTENGAYHALPCAQFHGFCQTKMNSLPPKVMERHLYLGSLQQDDHVVKVFNTETLAGEFDADEREHKLLLRAS